MCSMEVKMNQKIKPLLLLTLLSTLPMIASATSGDTTFMDIVTVVKAYLGGSLGLLFVLLAFLGSAAAVVGMAPMKVMFPVLALTLALHYGPGILEKIFAATGDVMFGHSHSFSIYDIAILMSCSMLAIIAFSKEKNNNVTLEGF